MVASLQHKKEALEAKLRDKTSELKRLCIEEAELTGVLPAETPLEPGETPPQIRRRVRTAFTYPESLINKLRSKEDEALATLELECKIQTGIAEAALGLANDGTTSKSVRRKHRVLYQESQRRLSELETRLNTLRQVQPKHKKKPRPQTGLENDIDCEGDEIFEHSRLSMLGSSHSDKSISPSLRHSHMYGGMPLSESPLQSHCSLHNYSGLPRQESPYHFNGSRVTQSHMSSPNIDYRHSLVSEQFKLASRGCNVTASDNGEWWWWGKGKEMWASAPQHAANYNTGDNLIEAQVPNIDKFRSLDRSAQCFHHTENDNKTCYTLPRSVYLPHAGTVLLPSQTYPENSLMRTQSLGNMDSSKPQSDRKTKEKEWYESSLDSTSSKPLPQKTKSPNPEYVAEKPSTPTQYKNSPPVNTQQASVNSVQFDTVVPYESPKNHTVVQAGKWQPYREVSKPFEMSDFYKYSTKFRKGQGSTSTQPPQASDPPSPQQKCAYKPLQPLECQPLLINTNVGENIPSMVSSGNSGQLLPGDQMSEGFSTDMLSWYHDKTTVETSRSATIV